MFGVRWEGMVMVVLCGCWERVGGALGGLAISDKDSLGSKESGGD